MKEEKKEEIVEEKIDIQPEQATEKPVLENQEPVQEVIDEKATKSEPPKIPTNDSNNEEKEVTE